MGYVMGFSKCYTCNQPFGYNPNYVPSVRVDGIKEPLCKTCIEDANSKRKALGISQFPVHPQAYEPLNEEELP